MSASGYVLDSFALLVLLQKEVGYGRVEALLKSAVNGEAVVHISSMNLAEVHCQVLRKGKDTSRILAALEALPLKIASADVYMSRAVDLRAQYGVAFGHCFAAALAYDLNCPLVTGDREFRKLGSTLRIEWLR